MATKSKKRYHNTNNGSCTDHNPRGENGVDLFELDLRGRTVKDRQVSSLQGSSLQGTYHDLFSYETKLPTEYSDHLSYQYVAQQMPCLGEIGKRELGEKGKGKREKGKGKREKGKTM